MKCENCETLMSYGQTAVQSFVLASVGQIPVFLDLTQILIR